METGLLIAYGSPFEVATGRAANVRVSAVFDVMILTYSMPSWMM
jgi:hypothetical protein